MCVLKYLLACCYLHCLVLVRTQRVLPIHERTCLSLSLSLSLYFSLALSLFLSLSLRFELSGDIQLEQLSFCVQFATQHQPASMAGSSDAANGAVHISSDEELMLMAPYWLAVNGCAASFLM